MSNVILKMENITKEFPGVKALDNVCLNVYQGQVMALLGENGAGKSTLMKILSGVYQKTSGEMYYKGQPLVVTGPKDAMEKGISIIHQELNLVEHLSIAENIFMGRFPNTNGKVNWKKMREDAAELLKRLNMDISPKTLMSSLSIGQKQMVEIAKALSFDSEIIIMDEPTDALTDTETESLFKVIEGLVKDGKSIVYISHRLGEIFEICHNITIIRDGKFIAEVPVSDIDNDKLIEMMVGRKLEDQFPYINCKEDVTIFEVEEIENDVVSNVAFKVNKGEILGVAGLMGAGRTELAKSIFGAVNCKTKKIKLNNEYINVKNEREAINSGISYVSEDRKKDGLVLGLSVGENITMASLKKFSKNMLINKKKEKEAVEFYVNSMSIKTPTTKQRVKLLSGGNQQKIAIGKALACEPKLLIIDEPTRGVDVGAKKEIYNLINEYKQKGYGVIMISSEIPELLGISDRIMVMKDGSISGELSREEATQESILRLAIGV